jgi:hypothetical protein
MSSTWTFEWHSRFRGGKTSVQDFENSGLPSSRHGNVGEVLQVIGQDRRRTINDVCNVLDLSYGTRRRILTEDLNMRRIAENVLPWLLNYDQKQNRLPVCRDL